MTDQTFYIALAGVATLISKIVFDWIKRPNKTPGCCPECKLSLSKLTAILKDIQDDILACKTDLATMKVQLTWLRDVHDAKLDRIIEELKK